MKRALTTNNILAMRFYPAAFDGEWKKSFGTPELHGLWLVYGASFNGKTSFCLQLAKYLTKFVNRVLFNSIEMGNSYPYQLALIRNNMVEVGHKFLTAVKESPQEIAARLAKKQSPDVVIIDSYKYFERRRMEVYKRLVDDFPEKLFIIIAHEDKQGMPDGALGKELYGFADVKIRVSGRQAFVNSRIGGSYEPFIIDEEFVETANAEF
ncbi:MAG: ATP-binding protein [Bacteroidales bacterium]|nr:ATP-binding protein [Bacteroidales bacterium]